MRSLREIYSIMWKDVVLEFRTKEIFLNLFFFGWLTLLLFNFALGPNLKAYADISYGILWLTFIFSGILGLTKSFVLERENDCLEGLISSPVERSNIYLGKTFASTLFMLIAELVLFFLFIIFFDVSPGMTLFMLLAVIFLGTLGFCAIGTLFSAMTENMRAREVMLPLLLFPLCIPLFLACVETTGALFRNQPLSSYANWLKLLVSFDVIFTSICFLTFEFVLEQ